MEPINLALDFDGVLCDSQAMVLDLYNNEFGRNLTKADILSYDMENTMGINKEKLLEYFDLAWEMGPPACEPRVGRAVEKIKELGYRICVVTKRTRGSVADVYQWLLEHDIPIDSFICIFDGAPKYEIARFRVIVDDAPFYLSNLKSNKTGFLYNQPWNRSFDYPRRVKSLKEVLKQLESIQLEIKNR